MFEPGKPFYMTRAVAEELPIEHRQFILQYISEKHQQLSDYLQIFEFYIEKNQQRLKQWQEEPERQTMVTIHLVEAEPIHRKVWVMDQGDHMMMLFPEDY